MTALDSLLNDIKKVNDELQEMVVEKDCIDDDVLKKTRELENLQEDYYSILRMMKVQF